jgi:hypothetical protein
VRTMDEINQERYALKALRGDFEQIVHYRGPTGDDRVVRALEAVRN